VFVDPVKWDLATDDTARLSPGEPIALGFDGSKFRDATALVASRLSDGYLFTLRVWERPRDESGADWRVPSVEVDRVIRNTFGALRRVGAVRRPIPVAGLPGQLGGGVPPAFRSWGERLVRGLWC